MQRVIAGEHGLPPWIESTYTATGELLGVELFDRGTYEGRMRADGTLTGAGQGILMSPTGANASWRGQAVGTFGEGGSIHWVGSIVYESDSPAFAGLRGLVGVFEWENGADGTVDGKIWAWR
ncbi:hypothetical protein [Kitasatospora sp. McL0602]|uniref:hypothetical protein n=1 Tax=Kitasatospora sp. McL0602 TaxID=3439530 RepID=UPI003F88C05C